MEGAGKGNKSPYKRENCQGICDTKCSLEGKGKGGSVRWNNAELLSTYLSYIVLWFREAKWQETRREKRLLAGKSRNAVKLASAAVFRSSLWPPACVTAFIAVLTSLWFGRGLWSLTRPWPGWCWLRGRGAPALGSGWLACGTGVSLGLSGHRAPLALHLRSFCPPAHRGARWNSLGYRWLLPCELCAINHLVLGGIQICNLSFSNSLPWPTPALWSANVWPWIPTVKAMWRRRMGGSDCEFGVSDPRKTYSASVSLSAKWGNNSAYLALWESSENPWEAIAWPLAHRKCAASIHGRSYLVLGSSHQKGHWHPCGATARQGIVVKIWRLRGDANDTVNYLVSLQYRGEYYIKHIVSHMLC